MEAREDVDGTSQQPSLPTSYGPGLYAYGSQEVSIRQADCCLFDPLRCHPNHLIHEHRDGRTYWRDDNERCFGKTRSCDETTTSGVTSDTDVSMSDSTGCLSLAEATPDQVQLGDSGIELKLGLPYENGRQLKRNEFVTIQIIHEKGYQETCDGYYHLNPYTVKTTIPWKWEEPGIVWLRVVRRENPWVIGLARVTIANKKPDHPLLLSTVLVPGSFGAQFLTGLMARSEASRSDSTMKSTISDIPENGGGTSNEAVLRVQFDCGKDDLQAMTDGLLQHAVASGQLPCSRSVIHTMKPMLGLSQLLEKSGFSDGTIEGQQQSFTASVNEDGTTASRQGTDVYSASAGEVFGCKLYSDALGIASRKQTEEIKPFETGLSLPPTGALSSEVGLKLLLEVKSGAITQERAIEEFRDEWNMIQNSSAQRKKNQLKPKSKKTQPKPKSNRPGAVRKCLERFKLSFSNGDESGSQEEATIGTQRERREGKKKSGNESALIRRRLFTCSSNDTATSDISHPSADVDAVSTASAPERVKEQEMLCPQQEKKSYSLPRNTCLCPTRSCDGSTRDSGVYSLHSPREGSRQSLSACGDPST